MSSKFLVATLEVAAGVDVPGGAHARVHRDLHVGAELQQAVREAADELELVVARAEY